MKIGRKCKINRHVCLFFSKFLHLGFVFESSSVLVFAFNIFICICVLILLCIVRFLLKPSFHLKLLLIRISYFFCSVEPLPMRSKSSKFYISREEYPFDVYPQYVQGPAYLLTRSAVHDLYEKSLEGNFLKFKDVYVTGIVAESANIYRKYIDQVLRIFYSYDKSSPLEQYICFHPVSFNDQLEMWKDRMDPKRLNITSEDNSHASNIFDEDSETSGGFK